MTSRLAALPKLAIPFALCVGLAPVGVASADDMPKVRYEISGSSPVAENIVYQTDAGQQRAVNANLPWSTQFTGFGGQVFVLSAQSPGTVTCKIYLNGNLVKDATATGTPARTVCTH
nr:MmpS family transport accessory protein [Mycobacterium sp. 1423905.2]